MSTSLGDRRDKISQFLQWSRVFTQAHLTGEGGVKVLRGVQTLLRDSQKQAPGGGLYHALSRLAELDANTVVLYEAVLFPLIAKSRFRSDLVRRLEELLVYLEDGDQWKEESWRDMLFQLFRAKAEEQILAKTSSAKEDLDDEL